MILIGCGEDDVSSAEGETEMMKGASVKTSTSKRFQVVGDAWKVESVKVLRRMYLSGRSKISRMDVKAPSHSLALSKNTFTWSVVTYLLKISLKESFTCVLFAASVVKSCVTFHPSRFFKSTANGPRSPIEETTSSKTGSITPAA